MKPILCIEFLAVFAWILLAEAYGAGENKLTVAMLRSATQTPYYVAAEAGLFKTFGLEVLPVQFSGGLAMLKSDRQFTMKVMEKHLRISDPKLLSEAYDFWVGVYSPKYYADPEEIETYFTLSKIKAKPQDFVDNSILFELEREGLFEEAHKKFGVR